MRLPATLLLLVFVATFGACGNGDQVRPAVVATFPAEGAVVTGYLGAIRIDYDQPVTILNGSDVRVTAGGVGLSVRTFQVDGELYSIYIAPFGGGPFNLGVDYEVRVHEGLAINEDEHYSLDAYELTFNVAPAGPLVVGGAGAGEVYLIDPDTFALTGANNTVPTPAGVAPLGIISVDEGAAVRTYVQLAGGDALAQFELVTDAAMTPVALTAPSTLSTSARAMAADIDGTYLYCAFREDMGGGVRLYRIDLATGLEDAFLDLTAVPTGASTSPAGLGLQGSELYVAAHDGASGTLAIVDLDTFTEVDTDGGLGGVQGVTLPSGAGPVAVTSGFAIVADPTASTATRVARSNFAILALDSTAGGASIDCVHTRDGRGVIQPLAGFDLDPRRPYVRRNSGGFTNANTREIFDLIGATSAATMDATALAELPTYSRFLLVLDGQIAVRLVWTGSFSQVDEDDIEDGVQAIDLTVAGPGLSGITVIGSVIPAFPPPGP